MPENPIAAALRGRNPKVMARMRAGFDARHGELRERITAELERLMLEAYATPDLPT